ncbi:MAG: nucleoside 2-deoxyribosyltransferase [Candidatus Paceibacterota bacterium]|jgi:nucleoside 2-deoxyribosyltransferase
MRQPKAYIASPLGFSELGRHAYASLFKPLVASAGFEILDPWELTSPSLIDPVVRMPYGVQKRKSWQRLNPLIARNNHEAIRQSHVVIAILDGIDVDSGTASEIGCAAALGKVVAGYRGDFRLSADNEGSLVNLQVEYFTTMRYKKIARTLDELKINLVEVRNILADELLM